MIYFNSFYKDEPEKTNEFLEEESALASAITTAMLLHSEVIIAIFESNFQKYEPSIAIQKSITQASNTLQTFFNTAKTSNITSEEIIAGLNILDGLEDIQLTTNKQKRLINSTIQANIKLKQTILKLVNKGGLEVTGFRNLSQSLPDSKLVTESLYNNVSFFIETHFDRITTNKIYSDFARLTNESETFNFADFDNNLKNSIKDKHYWNIVANNVSSRSYHYGAIKSAQLMNYTKYKIKAILDKRTSDICRELNGKIFSIARAADFVDLTVRAEGENIKNLHPWVKVSDIENLDDSELQNLGVMLPPFHAMCRTSIELL